MTLSIATTFETSIIDEFKEINRQVIDSRFKISETFGARITWLGSGRNSYRLPSISKSALKKYIKYSHQNGIGFNYLVNATCFSGKETSPDFIEKMCQHIEELLAMGVDIFTVANPFLIKAIRKNFGAIKINTSINSRIYTLEEAVRFLSLGIDRITLHYDQNRDFGLIDKVVSMSGAEVELLSNNPCLYYCIFANSHMNLDSHSSKNSRDQNSNTLYPTFNCKHQRLKNPCEIIRSRWIRPTDVKDYFDRGISIIKVAGRNMDQEWLANAARAYAFQIDSPQFYMQLIERGKWKYVSRENPSLGDLTVEVDLPSDFLEWFKKGLCQKDCGICHHCENLATEHVKFSSDALREQYLQESEHIVQRGLVIE